MGIDGGILWLKIPVESSRSCSFVSQRYFARKWH